MSKVIDGFKLTGDINLFVLLVTMALAFVLGVFIYIIYKKTFSGVIFVKSFGISLIMLCLITSAIILTISSNLMLSLGMVGALSIVRFRTAIKDPMDTVFMFWSIAAGISLGAQLYAVAIITTVLIGIIMIIVSKYKLKKRMPYILVLRFDEGVKNEVNSYLKKVPDYKMKAKTVSRGVVEMTLEINLHENELVVADRLAAMSGVYDASLISFNGDSIA